MTESKIQRALRHLDVEVSNAAVAVNSVRNTAQALRVAIEAEELAAEARTSAVEGNNT